MEGFTIAAVQEMLDTAQRLINAAGEIAAEKSGIAQEFLARGKRM